ncbi:metallophosphoesterase family protein [Leeuwenhoekiella nanhaiensis]|uniref:Calcineurin-like phosphoesterase domain-containing protein n=1 Tax=Leeuwenhoekiella nanhaiensis TaxID=1655491 RepID=A0A2G1VNU4_9FLAO|nr:metallophosphoesterase [Leeuwenhoekiella nanhaiensis]PHQ28432.1 hypothetical protein CJ305_15075 [Leeuwenhoekiella nanhaiensis]
MKSSPINRRNSLKLFTLAGTTVLTMPQFLWSCKQEAPKPFLRFGLLTDSHYAEREPAGTRFYRDSIPKMQEAIAELNTQNLDFIIHLGDFKDQDTEANPEDTLRYLKTIESEFQGFEGATYHALGNHDVDSIRKEVFLSHIKNTGQDSAKNYYSFDAGGFHIIVLDANYDAAGTDHFFAEGADWEDANIPPQELNWLKEDLAKIKKPTVVFCHHPLYEFYKEGSKFHVTNYQEVQKLFTENSYVVACFHGHVHQEDVSIQNGITYITRLGMVDYEGVENNAFSVVELTADKIEIRGYKRSGSKNFSWS